MKRLEAIIRNDAIHWVGDGFPVRTLFSYHQDPAKFSPFLLLDYAGPAKFEPAAQRRGVGPHPHKGFETVTIVLAGEVEHEDSAGGGGVIKPGDVQWMTAGSGIVHQELHSTDFSKTGGSFEMIQLWVNLPAKFKGVPPRYQSLAANAIPAVKHGEAVARVIAGELGNVQGAAQTYSPIDVWDVAVENATSLTLPVIPQRTSLLLVLQGQIEISSNQGESIEPQSLAILSPEGEELTITCSAASRFIWLSGEVVNEPVAGYGPFVMNTREELVQAFHDYQAGKMGKL